jgi:hypothetical protein
VRRLNRGGRVDIAYRGLGRDVRTGPPGSKEYPLYLFARIGAGRIAIVSDSELLSGKTSVSSSDDNHVLILNLVANLVGDRFPEIHGRDMNFRVEPEIGLITDNGATFSFEADRPCWGILKIGIPDGPFVIFRDLRTKQSIRIRGLGPGRE